MFCLEMDSTTSLDTSFRSEPLKKSVSLDWRGAEDPSGPLYTEDLESLGLKLAPCRRLNLCEFLYLAIICTVEKVFRVGGRQFQRVIPVREYNVKSQGSGLHALRSPDAIDRGFQKIRGFERVCVSITPFTLHLGMTFSFLSRLGFRSYFRTYLRG